MGGGVFFLIKDFLVYNEMRWKQEEFKMISQIVGYLVDLVMGFQISYTSGKKKLFESAYNPVRQIWSCLRIYYLKIRSSLALNNSLKAGLSQTTSHPIIRPQMVIHTNH